MKNCTLFICLLMGLNSCVSVKDLPSNLPKSHLIIEKNVIPPTVTNMKGLSKLSSRMKGNMNNRLEKTYLKYPFRYSVLDFYQIGDTIASSKVPVYILMNGVTTTTTTITENANGTRSRSTRSKTDILLLNIRTGKVNTISAVSGGVNNFAFVLNRKIKKQFKESLKKKSKSSSKSSSSKKKK